MLVTGTSHTRRLLKSLDKAHCIVYSGFIYYDHEVCGTRYDRTESDLNFLQLASVHEQHMILCSEVPQDYIATVHCYEDEADYNF